MPRLLVCQFLVRSPRLSIGLADLLQIAFLPTGHWPNGGSGKHRDQFVSMVGKMGWFGRFDPDPPPAPHRCGWKFCLLKHGNDEQLSL